MQTRNTYRVRYTWGIFPLIGARLIARSYQQPRRHPEEEKGKVNMEKPVSEGVRRKRLYEDLLFNVFTGYSLKGCFNAYCGTKVYHFEVMKVKLN